MAPSAIVALCFLALASAAPQNLPNLQCATSCDPSTQPYEVFEGKTYTYLYNVVSSVKLAGVDNAITQGGLTGTIEISSINPCESAAKFISSNGKVSEYPWVWAFSKYGKMEKICTHPDDDPESINIKKGVISSIQNRISSFSPIEKHMVSEMSVLGKCPTAYSVHKEGDNFVVNKQVVHSECQEHDYSQSELPSLLSKSPMPLQVSKTECTNTYSSDTFPQNLACKDTKIIRPAYGTYKYIEATQESTLKYHSVSPGLSVLSSINGKQLVSKKLTYDHSMQKKIPELSGKLVTVLKDVCEKLQGQGHPDTASVVSEAMELLEHIPGEEYITVLSKIRAGAYCADFSKLEALYLDAVAFIDQPGALKVIAQEVSAGRVAGGRTALYTAALHLVTKPTAKHVEALTPIAAMEDPPSTLSLAAASLINKHRINCKPPSGCTKCPFVNNIAKILTDKLVNQCTPAFSNSKQTTVLTTLKTLGNIGYFAPEHAHKVIKCVTTDGVDTNVRFAATQVLKGTLCETQVKDALKAIVLNKYMDTEVRIGSYLGAINCADEADLQELVTKITVDSNKQVQSFIFSHLNNLKTTRWPMKANLQGLLRNMNIPSTYESNIFKYSRNIEMSYNTATLGLGAAVESNVVYRPESYIPQLINLGLDMNILGSFINIGWVGARVEGLDPLMKEVFGPESYLYKTPLSGILKDTSLFIKQNGANMFKNMEKLIRNGNVADINTLIQTVSKLLNSHKIKLPKTNLYAHLLGQDFAFISLNSPIQDVNINQVVETITSAVVDALVAAKNLNINTARAAHYHMDYAIPTIQGIPLNVKLMTTAVTGIDIQSKFVSDASAHDAVLKIIPSLNLAINGHIGYGNLIKHGLKMKNLLYTTNGLAMYVGLKNGQDLDLRVELPEKMDIINVKSELYQVKADKMMTEEKIYPNNMNDKRIVKEHCSSLINPVTGLNICFKMNIPDVLNSNILPLGSATHFNIYLQKSEAAMKGYRVTAAIQNKTDRKVLKFVAGTYGSTNSKETSVKLSYKKEANTYLAAAEIKSVWFTSSAQASFMHQGDLTSMQFLANHQFNAAAPMAIACKFDLTKGAIANGKDYMVSGFAGLTDRLTETHKFLSVKMSHANNNGLISADFLMNTKTPILPSSLGFEMVIPSTAPWFTIIRKVDFKTSLANNALECHILRKTPGQYQNTLTIMHDTATIVSLTATHTITGNAIKNFQFITDASAKLGDKEFGATFNVKNENAVVDTVWTFKNAGAIIFNFNSKHIIGNKLFASTIEIGLPTLPKTFKFSNAINVLEFLSYTMTTEVYVDNTSLLQVEGPFSLQLKNTMIKHNVNLKISGAFDGTIKVSNTALLSLEKIQYTLDMKHSATPLAMLNLVFDQTNPAEVTTKAVINIPVLVDAEYVTVFKPKMVHTTMNTLIVPTTSLARRFKGYAEFDLESLKMNTNLYWDAEKDTNKKIGFTTLFKKDRPSGKLIVQGDLTIKTVKYGYKFEAVAASPSNWFLGTTGLELTLSAPSNKVMIGKALWTIEYSESLVIFKPIMAVHTLNENIYEITGSFAFKNLPAFWNFDISSEVIINIPQIQKMTLATKALHEDNNGVCAIVLKTGVTGHNTQTIFEITHGATGNRYTTLFKVQHGGAIGTVAASFDLISGFKAFDITVDASLPFAVVKALTLRATKTAEGTLTFTLTKNQIALAKLNYVMSSLAAHTLSLECPSRTIEFFVGFSGSELTMKVFPEKNLSPKVLKSIIRLTKKARSTNIECFINAPSLPKELRIAAEFFLTNPTMEKIVNIDIQFPTAEFKKLLTVVLEEIMKIYEDLVKDGVFPNLVTVYKELSLILNDLPVYLDTIMHQFIQICTEYWTNLKKIVITMWKNYEADFIALFEVVLKELLHYWDSFKIELPVLVNKLLTTIQNTEIWNILNGLVKQMMDIYPALFDILFDFYNKIILTTIKEVNELVKSIVNLPTFRLKPIWNLLVKELPVIIMKVKEQMLNSKLCGVIIEKIKYISTQYPAIYAAVIDFWAGFIKPVYTDLVIVLQKIMNINLTDISQLIDNLMTESSTLFNKIIVRLMDTKAMKLFIAMAKDFMAANQIIKVVFEEVIVVLHKTISALLGNLEMFYEKLMEFPVFRNIVEWIKHIINTKNISMDLSTIHTFITEVFGWSFSIAGDHISAVLTLPVSVTTLRHWLTTFTTHLPTSVDELIKSFYAFIENLPIYAKTVKEQVAVFAKIAAEQVPIIVKAIEAYVPKFIHEFVPVFNNIIEFMRNTEMFKIIMAKIDEVIKIYPAQFTLLKEYFEMFIKLVADYTTLIYNKMMEIPFIRRIVEYIMDLLHNKDVKSNMLSSWSSFSSGVSSYSLSSWNTVSSSLANYSSAVSSNVPSFIKLHTPSMVSSWMSTLMQ